MSIKHSIGGGMSWSLQGTVLGLQSFRRGKRFVHILPAFALGPEENLAKSPEPDSKKALSVPMGLSLWGSCQSYTFTQGLLCSQHTSLLRTPL